MGLLEIWENFKLVMTRSDDFFNKVRKDKGFSDAFRYYAVLLVIITAFSIASVVYQASSETMTEFVVGSALIFALFVGIVSVFITSGIYYVIAIVFGIRGEYYQTFKAVAYGSSSPTVIAALISTLLTLPLVLGVISSEMASSITYLDSSITFIFSLWGYYIIAKGISKLHNAPFGRSLVVVIILPILTILITSLAALYALGTLSPGVWTALPS